MSYARMCRRTILLALFFVLETFGPYPALADHYGAVFEQHEQCITSCEVVYDAAELRLGCSYEDTQNALRQCGESSQNTYNQCVGRCDGSWRDDRQLCRQTRRTERQECRETAREERPECRADRRVTIDQCNDIRRDDLDRCDGLDTRADRRDCRQQARQTARDCRQLARQQARICREDTRETRRECLDAANETRDICIDEAGETRSECRAECDDDRDSACLEERREANLCAELTGPARGQLEQCISQCNSARDAQLDGYNAQCSNGHGGTQGPRVTVFNNTGAVRFLYLGNTFLGRMMPGEQAVHQVPCGVSLTFDFELEQVDTATPEERTILPAFPCCAETYNSTTVVVANE